VDKIKELLLCKQEALHCWYEQNDDQLPHI